MVFVRLAAATGVLLVAVSCTSSSTTPSTPPTPTPAVLTGSVADAAGDALVTAVVRNGVTIVPTVAVPPDLVAATVTVSGGNLTATISFAPGTLSQTRTSACLMLDVDESAATGAVSSDANLGYDYSICAVNPPGSTTAQISRLGGGVSTGVGTVGATFPSANQVSFTVPLATLGNDDGRMAFKVEVIQYVDDPGVFNTNPIDWMPDIGKAAGLTR